MIFNPGSLFVTHKGQAGRLLSPRLWTEASGQMLAPDGSLRGRMIVEDFTTFGGILASTIGGYASGSGWFTSYQDSSNTITQLASEPTGVVRISLDATDNDESWLCPGGATSILGVISDTAGSDKLMVWEARVRPNQVSDNGMAFFVGLTEEGCAAADTKADNTGVMADKDYIGFDVVHADGDAMNVVYKKNGQTAQTLISGAKALTASAWINIGGIYNPQAPVTERIKFYVDGSPLTTYVTATQIAAATFPDGEELNFLIGGKNGSAGATTLDCDGFALFQAE